MRLHRAKDAPIRPLDAVFRESRLRAGIIALATLLLTVVPLVFAWHSGETIAWVFVGIISLIMGFVSLMLISGFIHTFHEGNWVIRSNPQSLLINLRTFDNDVMNPEDEVVVEFTPGEIAWIGKTVEHRLVVSRYNDTRTDTSVFLDIKPIVRDLSQIQKALAAEAKRPAPPWRGRNNFAAVRVVDNPDGPLIRVEWRSGWTHITPSIQAAIRVLSSGITVRPDTARELDLSASTNDRQEQENRILYLVERGDTIPAINLVRQLYGYSLKDARKFIDDLRGNSGAADGAARHGVS